MTAPNPQAGPLTGLDVGADGAGLPHPAPRQPNHPLTGDAWLVLLNAEIQTRSNDPHPGVKAADPRHDLDTGWACQMPEADLQQRDWGAHTGCLACTLATIADAVRNPFDELDWWDEEPGAPVEAVFAWQAVRDDADHWAAQNHPAAVHMQRIATELELRYGLGIEVRS